MVLRNNKPCCSDIPIQVTLDSIYYGPGSRVSCVARAVSNQGDAGREHYSLPVTISTEEGMCLPRVADAIGAEPYNARLRYTGPADPDHPNKIKLTVTMPHVGKWFKTYTEWWRMYYM